MDKEYFKEYFYNERNHWWFLVREKIIGYELTKLLKEKDFNRTIKILNVGCATGRTSEFLEKFGEVISLEYDEDCYNFVKEKLNINIVNGSVLDLPFENEIFDVVCAFDIIEHVHDDLKAAEEMNRVLKNNGNLILTVPAFNFLWSEHDEINFHFRRYTKKTLLNTLNVFKLNKTYFFNSILFIPIAIVRLLSRFKSKKLENKSDFKRFNSSLISKILYFIFHIDLFLIKKKIKPMFGTSIFLIASKK
jgi:SAM-dependent methyltransferase